MCIHIHVYLCIHVFVYLCICVSVYHTQERKGEKKKIHGSCIQQTSHSLMNCLSFVSKICSTCNTCSWIYTIKVQYTRSTHPTPPRVHSSIRSRWVWRPSQTTSVYSCQSTSQPLLLTVSKSFVSLMFSLSRMIHDIS